MGLFDFGDRATIQTLAYRIGVGVEQMESELRNSPNEATPMLRGLAHTIAEEIYKTTILVHSLSKSSQDSLKVDFKKRKINFWTFFTELVPLCEVVESLTGFNILDCTMINKYGQKVKIPGT
jgi:hypothetical protein